MHTFHCYRDRILRLGETFNIFVSLRITPPCPKPQRWQAQADHKSLVRYNTTTFVHEPRNCFTRRRCIDVAWRCHCDWWVTSCERFLCRCWLILRRVCILFDIRGHTMFDPSTVHDCRVGDFQTYSPAPLWDTFSAVLLASVYLATMRIIIWRSRYLLYKLKSSPISLIRTVGSETDLSCKINAEQSSWEPKKRIFNIYW